MKTIVTKRGGIRVSNSAMRACLMDLLALMLDAEDFDNAMRDMALMPDAEVRAEVADWMSDDDPDYVAIARKWGVA